MYGIRDRNSFGQSGRSVILVRQCVCVSLETPFCSYVFNSLQFTVLRRIKHAPCGEAGEDVKRENVKREDVKYGKMHFAKLVVC